MQRKLCLICFLCCEKIKRGGGVKFEGSGRPAGLYSWEVEDIPRYTQPQWGGDDATGAVTIPSLCPALLCFFNFFSSLTLWSFTSCRWIMICQAIHFLHVSTVNQTSHIWEQKAGWTKEIWGWTYFPMYPGPSSNSCDSSSWTQNLWSGIMLWFA